MNHARVVSVFVLGCMTEGSLVCGVEPMGVVHWQGLDEVRWKGGGVVYRVVWGRSHGGAM